MSFKCVLFRKLWSAKLCYTLKVGKSTTSTWSDSVNVVRKSNRSLLVLATLVVTISGLGRFASAQGVASDPAPAPSATAAAPEAQSAPDTAVAPAVAGDNLELSVRTVSAPIPVVHHHRVDTFELRGQRKDPDFVERSFQTSEVRDIRRWTHQHEHITPVRGYRAPANVNTEQYGKRVAMNGREPASVGSAEIKNVKPAPAKERSAAHTSHKVKGVVTSRIAKKASSPTHRLLAKQDRKN
jgi:Na+-transporting methylmalonyl-CoA/oxaloacetate decarboxylase gamma subunit